MKVSVFGKDLAEVKARLLCYGVMPNDGATVSNAFFNDSGFIHGSQLVLEDHSIVNVPVNESFVLKHSPFRLVESRIGFILYENIEPQCVCWPLKMPRWVHTRISSDVVVSDILRPHNENTLFCVPAKRCAFNLIGRKCLFCTFGGHTQYSVKSVRKALEIGIRSGQYSSVAVGGATPNLADFGLRYYSQIVTAIKQLGDLDVSVELVPPRNPDDLELLAEVGVDSVILNLEVYDEVIRRRVCPGKATISRDFYLKSMGRAVEIFGKGQVSSVLILGLEPTNSTLEGCRRMVDLGVVPTLIPFRPYDSCSLSHLPPTDPEYYFSVSRQVALMIGSKDMTPLDQPGCSRCGGCSLECALVSEVN